MLSLTVKRLPDSRTCLAARVTRLRSAQLVLFRIKTGKKVGRWRSRPDKRTWNDIEEYRYSSGVSAAYA